MSESKQSFKRIIWWLVRQIVEEPWPDESAAQRAQQVAILVTIWGYACRNEPLSAQQIAEIYGYDPPSVGRLIKRLMERGLVERDAIPQKTGKGLMYALRMTESPELGQLLKQHFGVDSVDSIDSG